MMIGGGGDSCSRADHGIGITEENEAKFGINRPNYDGDFGDNGNLLTSYSLNLWIKQPCLCMENNKQNNH